MNLQRIKEIAKLASEWDTLKHARIYSELNLDRESKDLVELCNALQSAVNMIEDYENALLNFTLSRNDNDTGWIISAGKDVDRCNLNQALTEARNLLEETK